MMNIFDFAADLISGVVGRAVDNLRVSNYSRSKKYSKGRYARNIDSIITLLLNNILILGNLICLGDAILRWYFRRVVGGRKSDF